MGFNFVDIYYGRIQFHWLKTLKGLAYKKLISFVKDSISYFGLDENYDYGMNYDYRKGIYQKHYVLINYENYDYGKDPTPLFSSHQSAPSQAL